MKFVPSKRDQTAIALPCPSIATCAKPAFWPTADRSCGAPKLPPAARAAACTIKFVPLERDQTAIAVPCPSTATCGSYESWPAAGRSCGTSHAGGAHAEPAPPPKTKQHTRAATPQPSAADRTSQLPSWRLARSLSSRLRRSVVKSIETVGRQDLVSSLLGGGPVDSRGGRQWRRRRRPAGESLRRRGVGGVEVPPRRLGATSGRPLGVFSSR